MGLHALASLANAQALLGETALAQATVTRTLQHHPQSATAWVVAGQVASLAGATLPTPPPAVADSPEYRRGWLQISLFLGEASRGRDISAALTRDADRSSDTLILRIDALLTDIDDVGVEERLERAHEIDRLATEITDGPGHSDASIRKALVGEASPGGCLDVSQRRKSCFSEKRAGGGTLVQHLLATPIGRPTR